MVVEIKPECLTCEANIEPFVVIDPFKFNPCLDCPDRWGLSQKVLRNYERRQRHEMGEASKVVIGISD